MTELLYLGDYSCRLISRNNTVLYINPEKGKDYSQQADIILQTTKTNRSLVQLHITTDQTKIFNQDLLEVGKKVRYQEMLIERIADDTYRIEVDDKKICASTYYAYQNIGRKNVYSSKADYSNPHFTSSAI